MGGKRRDAAKKEEKDEALTNGDAAGDSKADQSARKETGKKEAAAKTPAEAPSGKGNGTAEQAPAAEAAKEAASKVAETAKAAVTKTATQAKAAAAFVKRRPTDVALVLSVINSAVLLALLGGLSGAGYLAKTGRLESALLTFGGPHSAGGSSSSAQAFFALSATDIDGAHVPMSRYAGRLVVVANVASEDHVRGYTLQNYQRLNYLYEKYHARGLEILAFPCNQFGGLEPGGNADIKAAVRGTYNATFPLFSKVDVNGPNAHPVWRFLLAHQPANHGYPTTIDWNFNKFVVSKLGFPLVRYPLTFDDEDLEGIEGWIQANL